MFKFNCGQITNPETGKAADILVNPMSVDNIRDALIGGALILAGFAWTAARCFKNGADAYDNAEYAAFESLGLVQDK